MNRQERIRFFITEQCRELDETYRSCIYPKQILLGNSQLPLLEGSTLTFKVNSEKKISFRIRLDSNENISGEPLNIGIPLSQVESLSIKDRTKKHREPAFIFLLKNKARDKFIRLCHEHFPDLVLNEAPRLCKYLTVILGMDPNHERPNNIYCRVMLRANKFTFPFGTAKKIFMKDLPIMWQLLIDAQLALLVKTGYHHDHEVMTEMDDEAWDWFLSFLNLKWQTCPAGGLWLVRDEFLRHHELKIERAGIKRESEMPQLAMEEEVETSSPKKMVKYEAPESPESSSTSSMTSV